MYCKLVHKVVGLYCTSQFEYMSVGEDILVE